MKSLNIVLIAVVTLLCSCTQTLKPVERLRSPLRVAVVCYHPDTITFQRETVLSKAFQKKTPALSANINSKVTQSLLNKLQDRGFSCSVVTTSYAPDSPHNFNDKIANAVLSEVDPNRYDILIFSIPEDMGTAIGRKLGYGGVHLSTAHVLNAKLVNICCIDRVIVYDVETRERLVSRQKYDQIQLKGRIPFPKSWDEISASNQAIILSEVDKLIDQCHDAILSDLIPQ